MMFPSNRSAVETFSVNAFLNAVWWSCFTSYPGEPGDYRFVVVFRTTRCSGQQAHDRQDDFAHIQ